MAPPNLEGSITPLTKTIILSQTFEREGSLLAFTVTAPPLRASIHIPTVSFPDADDKSNDSARTAGIGAGFGVVTMLLLVTFAFKRKGWAG